MMRVLRSSLAVLLLLSAFGSCDGPTDPGQSVEHLLTVELSGHGRGSVTSQPAGINCAASGGTCTLVFPRGTNVTLNATSDAGHVFAGWSNACSGTGSCVVRLDGDRTVRAAFDNPQLTVTSTGAAGGTVTSADGKLTLTIPAGALTEPVAITIERISADQLGAEFNGYDVLEAYVLGPSGTQFQQPVTVSLNSEQLPAVTDAGIEVTEETLLISSSGVVQPLENQVMTVGQTITLAGELSHFSRLVRVFGSEPSQPPGKYLLTVAGIPDEALVGETFDADVKLLTVTPLTVPVSEVRHFDDSTEPVVTLHQFPALGAPLPLIGTVVSGVLELRTYGNEFRYVCTAVGPGMYTSSTTVIREFGRKFIIESQRIRSDVNCNAAFVLNVEKTGFGDGTVMSDPLGIDCGVGDGCFQRYPAGSSVLLRAVPDENSEFGGWMGACALYAMDPIATVALNDDRLCIAKFNLKEKKVLQVGILGNGQGFLRSFGEYEGLISCGNGETECTAEVPKNETISIAATALEGFGFLRYRLDGEVFTDPLIDVSMDKDRLLEAEFVVGVSLGARLVVGVEGSGTVRFTGPGGQELICSEDACGPYEYLDFTSVHFWADPLSRFVEWKGHCLPTGAPGIAELRTQSFGDYTCIAVFSALPLYSLEFKVPHGVDVRVDNEICSSPEEPDSEPRECTYKYPEGSSISVRVEMHDGWEFLRFGGSCPFEEAEFVIESLDQSYSCDVEVQPVAVPQRLTVTITGNGDGLVFSVPFAINCAKPGPPHDCSSLFPEGATVRLFADAAAGSVFTGWGGDCVVHEVDPTIADVVVDHSRDCTAEFTRLPRLTVIVSGDGTVTDAVHVLPVINCRATGGLCVASFEAGFDVILVAIPDRPGMVVEWGQDCERFNSATTGRVVMDGDRTCTVRFEDLTTWLRARGGAGLGYRSEAIGGGMTSIPPKSQPDLVGDGARFTVSAQSSGTSSTVGVWEMGGDLRTFDVSNPDVVTLIDRLGFAACPGSRSAFVHENGFASGLTITAVVPDPPGVCSTSFPQVGGTWLQSWAPRVPAGGAAIPNADGTPTHRFVITNFSPGQLDILDPLASFPNNQRTVTLAPTRSCPFTVITTPTHAYVVTREGVDGTSTAPCNDNRGLYVVNLETAQVEFSVLFGSKPREVTLSPDGTKAYVTDFEENRIHVIDLINRSVARTITTGAGPVGIAVTPDGRHLVVTNWSMNKVQLVDEGTGAVIAEEDSRGEQPVKVVLANDGYTIVVLNFGNDTTDGSISVYTLEGL